MEAFGDCKELIAKNISDTKELRTNQIKIRVLIEKLTTSIDNLSEKLDTYQNRKLRAIDLFCGCGGMSQGLSQAGVNIIAGIDYWAPAINSYSKNYNHLALCRDLTIFSPEEFDKTYNIIERYKSIDLLVGGPPCQGFSLAGKRDNNDPRNSLFMEYVKYLNYFNPRAFIMENVVGILSMKTADKQSVIDIIMVELNRNYNTIITKLYACDFEVPQARRRVIIIGIRKDIGIFPTEPREILSKSERIPVSSVLLPRDTIDQSYYLSERAIAGIMRKKENSQKSGKGFGAQFLDLSKPSYTIPARYWKDGYDALIKYEDDKIRKLTILELRRIQSFPDSYIIEGSCKDIIIQIGNAVACRFAYHLGRHLIDMLNMD